jgi:hypothetical protein
VTSCGLAFTTSTDLIGGGSVGFAFVAAEFSAGAFAHPAVRQIKTSIGILHNRLAIIMNKNLALNYAEGVR